VYSTDIFSANLYINYKVYSAGTLY